jgi:2',3'-cyclic-nucleotide 2'-phosphodiesterase (5'-nucleotidase family)
MRRAAFSRVALLALLATGPMSGCDTASSPIDSLPGTDVVAHGDAASDVPDNPPADDRDDSLAPGEVPAAPDAIDPMACFPGAAQQTVTFVHVNDLHSGYIPTPDGNPFARLAGYLQQVRAENPYTLFTDGGDDHEKGCLAEQTSKGESTVQATRLLGFDARVLGNHDFAWSLEEALKHSRSATGIVEASNITYIGDDPKGFGAVEYAEKDVGCVRVGFFGLVSGPWDDQDTPYDGDFYPELPTRFDYEAIATRIVQQHRADVDLMVLVSHLGNDMDRTLAAAVPGIDVILGGHSHTTLAEPGIVGDTWIVQSGSGGNFVTRLDVTVDLAQRRVVDHRHELLVNLPGALPADPDVEARLAVILEAFAPGILARITTEKEHRGEQRLAELAARAAVRALNADAALVDPGTTWSGIRPGPVSPQDLLNAFLVEREPAGTSGFSSLVLAEISGADLQAIREGMPDWGFAGPAQTEPTGTYTIALQKRTAYRPDLHLPQGVTLWDVRPSEEVWFTLMRYALLRNNDCLYFDIDEPLPSCD